MEAAGFYLSSKAGAIFCYLLFPVPGGPKSKTADEATRALDFFFIYIYNPYKVSK
jgi:hypothetical protein